MQSLSKVGGKMEAIVEICGSQFRVKENQEVFVPHLAGKPGEQIEFDRLLYVRDGTEVKIGKPIVDGKVVATVLEHGKGQKVIVFKKKRRKGYRVKNGHRQLYTKIKIEKIEVS